MMRNLTGCTLLSVKNEGNEHLQDVLKPFPLYIICQINKYSLKQHNTMGTQHYGHDVCTFINYQKNQ